MRVYFLLFFFSGFCSLVYEVVWLRLAMAKFGVTTPLVSIVLSLFMGGLAIGSWAAGRLFLAREGRTASYFLRLYALAELSIGISALAVPLAFEWGRRALTTGAVGAWGSSSYYLASGALIGLALLPFCACMGATFPLAMASLRKSLGEQSRRSFSYLYVANVVGAGAGTLVSAFVLIELLGFQRTLAVTAVLNGLVAAVAGALSLPRFSLRSEAFGRATGKGGSGRTEAKALQEAATLPAAQRSIAALPLLFLTGVASLAMELVWVRQFTPYLGPLVYSFASILAVYLASNALGSYLYRLWVGSREHAGATLDWPAILVAAGLLSLVPLVTADPRLLLDESVLAHAIRILGIGPFCAAAGFLTPLLVDRWSGGDPDRAGKAYAVNVVGCILGPLLAGFWLLPWLGERGTLSCFAFVLLALGATGVLHGGAGWSAFTSRRRVALASAVVLAVVLIASTKDYESLYSGSQIRRDSTATVIAAGHGMRKRMLINGYGITTLTPSTKMMAHLPMAFLPEPKKALAICFGMGTSFRSLLSWGVRTTAVELVPSVPALFGYYHDDGPELLRSPLAEVVIDDGRRFLERNPSQYDVITIDPPPPVQAAGSSLLYSRDFYSVVKKRLAPGGIVQQWLPQGDPTLLSSVARALRESFPYVRVFGSLEGWGLHFLASESPLLPVPAAALAARLPSRAAADLIEWGPWRNVERQFQTVLGREVPLERLIDMDPKAPTLEDDRPVNEYDFLRRLVKPPPKEIHLESGGQPAPG